MSVSRTRFWKLSSLDDDETLVFVADKEVLFEIGTDGVFWNSRVATVAVIDAWNGQRLESLDAVRRGFAMSFLRRQQEVTDDEGGNDAHHEADRDFLCGSGLQGAVPFVEKWAL